MKVRPLRSKRQIVFLAGKTNVSAADLSLQYCICQSAELAQAAQ